MTRDLVWRLVERRLRRALPPAHAESTLGDLAEDYAWRRDADGRVRAYHWLWRESRSLSRAYWAANRDARPSRFCGLAGDATHAWRRIVARPATSIICTALLALGIGLCTTMFSVVDALLLRPAPFRDAERLVTQGLWHQEPAVIAAWRSSGLFETVAFASLRPFTIETGDLHDRLGVFITPDVLTLLGVRPALGRAFTDADAQPGAPAVVLISDALWRSAFGGDAGVIGRTVRVDGTDAEIAGVMPKTFLFPSPAISLWQPLNPAASAESPMAVFGRLRPGVPHSVVEPRTTAIAREVGRPPSSYRSGAPPLQRLGTSDLGTVASRAIWLLLAGAVLVFAALSANASGLLLAQLSTRRREFGMCAALGASRGRLLRQAAIEHAAIGIAGALGGLGLAWALTSRVPSVFVGHTLNLIDVDLRAMVAASGLGVAAIIAVGLTPAWIGTKANAHDAIRGSRQIGNETRASRVMTRGLLTAQVALACSLLIGAALLVRSFGMLIDADRGLDDESVVRVSIGGMDEAFASYDAMAVAALELETRLAATPGVARVSLSREIPPLPASNGRTLVHLERPQRGSTPASAIAADEYRVGSGYFDTYGITIKRGRAFVEGDDDRQIIVGERLARMLWPDQDPIGQSLTIDSRSPRRQVVGVVGELTLPTLDASLDLPEFYTPLGRARTLYVNYRCGTPCPADTDIRAIAQAVHPLLRARLAPPASDVYRAQLRLPLATAQVAGLFGLVALLTAAGGLFSVLTVAVARRRREFGIRAALGASPAQMRRLVMRDGFSVVIAGIAAGLAGGWLVGRSLAAFHYGVTLADPFTWLTVAGTLAAAALAAAWRPARQAMRVNPVTLLREE